MRLQQHGKHKHLFNLNVLQPNHCDTTFSGYFKRVKSHFTYFEKHWRVFDSSMAQRSVSDWATVVRAACYQGCVHCGTTGSVLSLGVLPAPVF